MDVDGQAYRWLGEGMDQWMDVVGWMDDGQMNMDR